MTTTMMMVVNMEVKKLLKRLCQVSWESLIWVSIFGVFLYL